MSNDKFTGTLWVLLKTPELGKAKTRLAASIGDQAALIVYQELIAHTQQIVNAFNCKTVVGYTNLPTDTTGWSKHISITRQRGKTLGERMAFAIKNGIHKFSTSCILIGSDCYELQVDHLNQAAQALKDHDVVIGPAHDGGYYLIAMKKNHPELFSDDIQWSTATVMSETMQRAQELKLTVFQLPVLSDVDTINDLPLELKLKFNL